MLRVAEVSGGLLAAVSRGDTHIVATLARAWTNLLTSLRRGITLSETDRGDTTEGKVTGVDVEAELRRLREDNEALRFSSLSFGELAERLSRRVRELERMLGERESEEAPERRDPEGSDLRPLHRQ